MNNSVDVINTVMSAYTCSPISKISPDVSGVTVNGTFKLNGKDIESRLAIIERVLGIPETNEDMFTKYPSLKKKYDDYIDELAKMRTWDSLKGS